MYLIELIIKKFLKKKSREESLFDVNGSNETIDEDYENCEHLFMPIDSTNQVLACTKCGLVVKRNELKKKNFFEK